MFLLFGISFIFSSKREGQQDEFNEKIQPSPTGEDCLSGRSPIYWTKTEGEDRKHSILQNSFLYSGLKNIIMKPIINYIHRFLNIE